MTMSIACPFKAMKTAKSVGIGISNDGKSDGSVKYREVSDLLRKEILAGKYSPGSAFPSLKMICCRFGVSYLTAVRATESLKELGLVRSKNGVGTFVKRQMMTVGLVMPMLKQVEVYPPICQEFSRLCLEKGVSIDFADISALRSDRVRPVVVAAARRMVSDGVAGVVFHPVDFGDRADRTNREVLRIFRSAKIPVVILDANMEAERGLAANLQGSGLSTC